MCLTAKIFGLQEENITSPNRRERPLIGETGWGTTERKREAYGQKEREIGREDAVPYEKEDKSLIDVENVELQAKGVAI